MQLFNPALLRPRNLIVVAVIAVAAHLLVTPVYNAVSGKTGDN